MRKVEIKYTNEFSKIERREWNNMESSDEKGRLYSSMEWLDMVGKSDGIAQQAVFVKEGDKLLMGLTFDIMPKEAPKQYNLDKLLDGESEYLWDDIELKKRPKSYMPSVIFSSRASRSYDVRFNGELKDSELEEVFNLIYQTILNEYGNEYNITFLYIPESNELLIKNLIKLNFNKYLITANYCKKMDFDDFSKYLSLFQKKKRNNIKNEINKLNKSDYSVTSSSLISKIDEYVALAEKNYTKYGYPNFDQKAYKTRMKLLDESFGEKAILLNIIDTVNKNIVATSLYIDYEGILYGRGVGIDYDRAPKKISPYFNVVYYEGINLAIRLESKYLIAGDGLDRVKLSRKMEPENLYIFSNESDSTFKENMTIINNYSEERLSKLYGESIS